MSGSNEKLLENVKRAIQKNAFAPMPPADPNAAAMGGAPPMDPAMAGGAPPMDPAMMGGAPPMDPAMMGGAPPMDPAALMGAMEAMGGAPPAPPAPGGESVMVSLDDLRQLFSEVSGGGAGDAGTKTEDGRVTNKDLNARIDELSQVVYMMANAMGVTPPAAETGGAPELGPESPEDLAALMGGGAAPAPMEALPPESAKTAAESERKKMSAKEAESLDADKPGYLRELMLSLHQNR